MSTSIGGLPKIPLALVIVRQAKIFDLPEIMGIEKLSFEETYPRGIFLMFLENNPDTFLVAEYGGRVIGYVMAYLKPDLEGHVMSIAVHPDYRGSGVGSTLLTEVIKRLFSRGAEYVGLEVRVSNERAIKLYERFGFVRARRIPAYYSNGEDAYYMVLTAENWEGS